MKHVCARVSAGVIILTVVALLVWYFGFSCRWTRSFSEKIHCRCARYSPPRDSLLSGKDCNKIAEAFRKAVAFKDPKRIGAGDYQQLMKLVNEQNFPCDKVLFWSKTRELVHSYQGELLTLNKMLMGHIADDLMWCGDKKSPEVKYGPYQEMKGICHDGPTRVFWEVASKWFAKNACEKVHVLLNGSSSESVAYNVSSVFASLGVSNLTSEVTELKACVIHDRKPRVSCSGASINKLNLTLSQKNISFTCEDKDRVSVGVIILFAVMSVLVWCSHYRKPSFQETIHRRCSRYSPPPDATLRQWSFYDEVLQRCLNYSPPQDAPLRPQRSYLPLVGLQIVQSSQVFTCRVDKDCEKIAEAFTNAFISKDPCHVRAEDYQPLMQLVNQAIPRDKVLLWSKTSDLKEPYKKARGKLLTLEHMLVGHIADNLTWCGDRNTSEVQLDSCPEKSDTCPHPAAGVFWNVSSKWFAENASGQVHVLLNGSSNESVAYNVSSVFASVEVPNLSSEVRSLHACVIHDSEARDSCSGSIQQLESDLRKREDILNEKIEFTCKDMKREAFLECLKNRGISQCKSVLRDSGMIGLILALLLSINMPDSGATLVGS